jgi:hypothetical protein
VTVSLMFPVPEPAHVLPAVASQVQVNPDNGAGRASTTLTPTASEGPPLVTVTV